MRINANSTIRLKNNQQNSKQNKSLKPTFEGHKLMDVFDVPHYKALKGYVYELTNKQKVIIIPKKGPGATSVNTLVKTGAHNEVDKQRGISHFLEHLAFRGSNGLRAGQFFKITKSKGAEINAHTGQELTAFFFQVNDANMKDYEDLLSAHATMIKYPKISLKQFKKEKEVVIKEINQSKDSLGEKQYFNIIKNLFSIKSNSPHMILGTEENIRNITLKDVMNYHKRAYTPDNMETYVVGDVSHKKIIKLIDKFFDTKDFRPAKVPNYFESLTPIDKTKIDFIATPKVRNSNISLGFSGPENLNKKECLAAEALLRILTLNKSSRLNKHLSDINTIAYSQVSSVSTNPKAFQSIMFAMGCRSGDEQKALDAVSQSFRDLKTNPISEKELEVAKRIILNEFNILSETSSSITDLLENFGNIGGVENYKTHVNDIKNITLEEVNSVAEKYLDTNKASISIIQPESAQNKNITFTGKSLISPSFIKKKVLPNNINLILNDNINTIRMAMNFSIMSPVEKKIGVNDILSKMMENATARYDEEAFSNLKSENALNFEVINLGRGIGVKISGLKESLSTGLDLLKETVLSPRWDEKSFLNAKDELLLEFNNQPLSARDRLIETVYDKHPLGESFRLLRQELEKVQFEDVKNYYNNFIQNAYAKAVITGPISNADGLSSVIDKKLGKFGLDFQPGKLERPAVSTSKSSQIVVQAQEGLNQSHVIKFFHLDRPKIEDIAALKIMNNILGEGISSRLFNDLREKQELAYQVGSSFNTAGQFAQLGLFIKTDIKQGEQITDNIEKALVGFENHLDILKTKLPTVKEVADAKKSVLTALSMKMESADGINNSIASELDFGGASYYNKLLNAIDSVTPKDIRRVAQDSFSKPSVTSILTSKEAAQKTQKFLEARGEYRFFADEFA